MANDNDNNEKNVSSNLSVTDEWIKDRQARLAAMPPEEREAVVEQDHDNTIAFLHDMADGSKYEHAFEAAAKLAEMEPRLRRVYGDRYLGATLEDNFMVIKFEGPIPELLQKSVDKVAGLRIESVALEKSKGGAAR